MSKAPYRHSDGSDCYTVNCSRGHYTSSDTAVVKGDINAYIEARDAEKQAESLPEDFINNVKEKFQQHKNQPKYVIQVMKEGILISQYGAPNKFIANMLKANLEKKYENHLVFIWKNK